LRKVKDKTGATTGTGFACAKVLKAMADETRLRILRLLFWGEKSVGEIADALDAEQAHVSHHLAILRAARLVEEERMGKRVMNRLHPQVYASFKGDSKIDLGCCVVEFRLGGASTEQ
jgi:DNA-binding transcriptional ArsR family regulator